KTIDDLLTSADFIQIILYKLNIEQFLQFMKAATELQNNLNIKANALQLQNLFSDMTTYIDQNLEILLQNDAVGVLQIVFNYDICESFCEYCIYLICLNPNALFDNPRLTQLDRSILFFILQCDDMGKLNEKKIFDCLIKWGTAQHEATILKSMMTWTSREFVIFEKSINDFIPLIRWFAISIEDFNQIRYFLENILPNDLYDKLVDHNLDRKSSPNELNKRYLPCTFLLKPWHFKIFENWIEEGDKNKSFFPKLFKSNTTNEKKEHSESMTLNMKPSHFSNNNLYDFVLLYRGTDNNFD
ncbi:3104_t:CDS:2, partial [Racocetra fulgida]